MKKMFFICALLAFGLSSLPGRGADYHTDPSCWRGPRSYDTGPADAAALSTIKITHIDAKGFANQNMIWSTAPNGVYRFSTLATKDSAISPLVVDVERPYLLRIDGTQIVGEKWLTENWLYFQVWGSHIRGINVIFDVESEKVRLADTVEDGQYVYDQFKESCKQPGAHCACAMK